MAGHGQDVAWMLLFGALTVVGLLLLTVLAIRVVGGGIRGSDAAAPGGSDPAAQAGTASAHQILAERYARGDIDADEYRERLRVLKDGA